jgi:hypothetical protein
MPLPFRLACEKPMEHGLETLVMGFLRLEAAGGLFIGWLPMGWGVLHILVLVAILVSVCSLSG